MHPQVQAVMNNLTPLEEEAPATQYPTVAMMFEEMKRVALKDLKDPTNKEELEDLMRFCFVIGFNHALTQQLLLQTKPGSLAEKVSGAQAAESITFMKSFRTYYGKPKRANGESM